MKEISLEITKCGSLENGSLSHCVSQLSQKHDFWLALDKKELEILSNGTIISHTYPSKHHAKATQSSSQPHAGWFA